MGGSPSIRRDGLTGLFRICSDFCVAGWEYFKLLSDGVGRSSGF